MCCKHPDIWVRVVKADTLSSESNKWSQRKYNGHNKRQNPTPGDPIEVANVRHGKVDTCAAQTPVAMSLGRVLHMGSGGKLNHTIFEMFKQRSEGDMLMYSPITNSWRALCTYAYVMDRQYWRTRVRKMRQLATLADRGRFSYRRGTKFEIHHKFVAKIVGAPRDIDMLGCKGRQKR